MATPASTKTNWKKAGEHEVKLPSSTVVKIRLPNLPEMIRGGSFPNNLLPIAIKRVKEEEITADKISELADYHRFLVHTMVLSPPIELEDVPDLPSEDVDMLIAFANRERDTDAVGHHLSGLETDEQFRKFRRLDGSDADLLNLPGV